MPVVLANIGSAYPSKKKGYVILAPGFPTSTFGEVECLLFSLTASKTKWDKCSSVFKRLPDSLKLLCQKFTLSQFARSGSGLISNLLRRVWRRTWKRLTWFNENSFIVRWTIWRFISVRRYLWNNWCCTEKLKLTGKIIINRPIYSSLLCLRLINLLFTL